MTTLDQTYWNEAPLQTSDQETTDFIGWLKQQTLFPYKLYQHQLDMISFVCNNERSNLRCARQMGTTTAIMLHALYQAYQHGKNVFVVVNDTLMVQNSIRDMLKWVESSAISHNLAFDVKHQSIKIEGNNSHSGSIRWYTVHGKTKLRDCNRGFANTLVVFDNVDTSRSYDDANVLAQTCNRSITINPNSHEFTNHNTALFPWHLHHPLEFKQRMIDTMGIDSWNREFEV